MTKSDPARSVPVWLVRFMAPVPQVLVPAGPGCQFSARFQCFLNSCLKTAFNASRPFEKIVFLGRTSGTPPSANQRLRSSLREKNGRL